MSVQKKWAIQPHKCYFVNVSKRWLFSLYVPMSRERRAKEKNEVDEDRGKIVQYIKIRQS